MEAYQAALGLLTHDNIFGEKILPPDNSLAWEEAHKTRSIDIYLLRTVLRSLIRLHGPTIRTRWMKKTRKQREQILKQSWFRDMPQSHRSDIELVYARFNKGESIKDCEYDLFLYPYINVEDLMEGDALLRLFQARARNHPFEFVARDLESIRLGIELELFGEHCNTELTRGGYLHFQLSQNPGDYVVPVKHDGPPDADTPQIAVGVSNGLYILQVQRTIMQFLLTTGLSLLHDIRAEQLVRDSDLHSVGSLLRGHNQDVTPLTAESTYAYSTGVDLDLLVRLIRDRREHAVDDVRSLRTDPGFYDEHMRCAFADQERHQPIENANKRGALIVNEVWQTFDEVELWSMVLRGCLPVREIYTSGKDPNRAQLDKLRQLRSNIVFAAMGIVDRLILKFPLELDLTFRNKHPLADDPR